MSSENHSNNHITIDAIIKWIPFFCFWLQSSFNSSKFILLLQPFQTSNAKHIILKILINPIFLSILNDFFQWFPWSFSRSFIGKANSNNSCQLAGCSDKIHQLIVGKASIGNPQGTQSISRCCQNHIFNCRTYGQWITNFNDSFFIS